MMKEESIVMNIFQVKPSLGLLVNTRRPRGKYLFGGPLSSKRVVPGIMSVCLQ